MLPLLALVAITAPELQSNRMFEYQPGFVPSDKMYGSAMVQMLIDPAGKPETCTVLAALHKNGFEDKVCAMAMKGLTFKPAQDDAGRPFYGVFRRPIAMSVRSGVSGFSRSPEITIYLSPAAPTFDKPIDVFVDAVVAADGRLVRCEVEATNKAVDWAKVACAQLPSLWRATPVANARGENVPYVRSIMVSFDHKRSQ